MKKITTLILTIALAVCAVAAAPVKADETTVYVTIVNGDVVLTQKAVNVTDVDGDGTLTINDALYNAHEANFEGGAAQGYGSAVSDWGLSLTKLWGIENGGSYGYYVNNVASMGLADPVKNGDYISAFVYQDTTAFSDQYCFFNENTVAAGDSIELTLSAAGYDESWNPVVLPVAGAAIVIDGEKTAYVTDEAGKVSVKAEAGSVISAALEGAIIVAPVCLVTDKADETPETGDNKLVFAFGAICLVAAAVAFSARKKEYEA